MDTHTLPDQETMFEALVNRNSSFEGIFFAAIKTTGIFCRPTCTAKKPLAENVEYFSSCKEALLHGYRPCKICTPEVPLGSPPKWIRSLFDQLQENPEEKISDYYIRTMGLEPSRVRRWFKKHYGMTFQAFQRSMRINLAIGALRNGDSVTQTAFAQGFDGLGGFGKRFKDLTGVAPRENQQKTLVHITRILSPLGPLVAGSTEAGVCLLEFADRPMLETQLKRLKKHLNAALLPGSSPLLAQLGEELSRYFAGELKEFSVPLILPGSTFQQQVWDALRQIPYGNTRSYQQQAHVLHKPDAARAVARANGDNRIAIVVPCHRIIGKDGALRGYGGGIWRKKYLLELESKHQ
ncbi:MAG: methylated-DNA--[protein]-cysteine S-methyltransferase [Bacteroidota bacterium]